MIFIFTRPSDHFCWTTLYPFCLTFVQIEWNLAFSSLLSTSKTSPLSNPLYTTERAQVLSADSHPKISFSFYYIFACFLNYVWKAKIWLMCLSISYLAKQRQTAEPGSKVPSNSVVIWMWDCFSPRLSHTRHSHQDLKIFKSLSSLLTPICIWKHPCTALLITTKHSLSS